MRVSVAIGWHVACGQVGHGLAVLRQREEVQPDQIDGGTEGFWLWRLARAEPGCRGHTRNQPGNHETARTPRGHGENDTSANAGAPPTV